MKNGVIKQFLLLSFLSISQIAFAQNATESDGNLMLLGILIAVVVIAFFLIIQVADNLLSIEAKNSGLDTTKNNFSIFPSLGEIFRTDVADYAAGKDITVLKAGHDILLKGAATGAIKDAEVNTYAVQPQNFLGISPIPKMVVEVGASIKAGEPIFFDKKAPTIKHVAPVSGEVIAVNRGAKRSIAEVVILADKDQVYGEYPEFDLEKGTRDELVAYLLESGIWPFIRQRPYNIIANPEETPSNIFVSTFDSAPLAPDLNLVVEGKEADFQKGLDVLAKLTDGAVHLGLSAKGKVAPANAFTAATGVEKHWFHGAHPAGNVGIQIHHTAPVDNNNKAWAIDVQAVITLGRIFTERKFIAERVVALTGAELNEPCYVKTNIGANIGDLLKGNLQEGNNRIVSGDVLSGTEKQAENFLNAFDDQVTVLAEGDHYEAFGWLLPLTPRPSISGTFPNGLFPDLQFEANTNTHGEKRAFVVTGQYESMLPMDMYPQHLIKAILVNDFERMEGLGIYELVEEDIALAEFACTSKQPLQQILRQGLTTMLEQG